jgi:hypothetical protein
MPLRGDRLRWPPRPGKRSLGTRQAPSTGETTPVPRQPNERDTSSDSQRNESDAGRNVMRQAHDDVQRGLEDTDCRNRVTESLTDAVIPNEEDKK